MHYFYKHMYYATWCRFDELLAGVALAYARHHHPGAWRRLMARGGVLLGAGGAVTAAAFALFLADRYGQAVTVFGYPLLALGFSSLIAAALAPGSLLHRVRVPGAGSLALWSYAIYLTHKQVCILVAAALAPAGFGAGHPVTILGALALSVLAGWLLYLTVETPFMHLRARWVPGNAAAPAVAAEAVTR